MPIGQFIINCLMGNLLNNPKARTEQISKTYLPKNSKAGQIRPKQFFSLHHHGKYKQINFLGMDNFTVSSEVFYHFTWIML